MGLIEKEDISKENENLEKGNSVSISNNKSHTDEIFTFVIGGFIGFVLGYCAHYVY